METFRLRNSSPSASTDDRSASRRLKEGNGQVQKQINFVKFASGSIAQDSDTSAENLVKCKSGWRYSYQEIGTPIKKLLADEMLRETEPKKRSPGVIARLMGFDGLPPQQLSHKQPKRSGENFQPRMTSTEKSQRSSTSCSRRSSKRSSKEEQEFKDVFEVSDSSKMGSSCYSLKGPARPKLTEAEMQYVKQKLLDVTRLSTDENLHESEEFHDAIEDLHSNRDLLIKYLEEPDSLFTKHLHDLLADPLPSHCTHISGMKLSSARGHERKGLGGKTEKENLWKQRKNQNKPFSHSNIKLWVDIDNAHFDSSKVQVEGKVEPSVLPTRIVVLKPNYGKVQNATRSVSSSQSPHDLLSDCKKDTEFYSVKDWEVELCAKKRFSNDAVLQRYKCREPRDVAKEITRQMRYNLDSGQTKLSASGFIGYAGDESSSNRSDNESANDSDVPALVSRNSIHRTNRRRHLSSRLVESSVSKEARKRLSERWKMTHRSVDMGTIGRGSTLGEMLAMPDREGRPSKADAMGSEKGCTDKFVGIDRPIGWVEPLGISSRDGWKDGCVGNFSRSRSVPASCTSFGSPRTGMIRETLCNEKYRLPKEATQQERIKLLKGNFNHREASSSRNSRSRAKISHFSVYSYTDYSDTSPQIQFSRKKVQNRMVEDDHIKKAATDSRFDPQDDLDVEIENAVEHSKPNTEESPAYTTAQDTCSTLSQESSFMPPEKESVLKHSASVLESPGSSKEAEQPSPVSVLEIPFPDDRSSSSEYFESVSADIQGLWMQIQLLKSESEPYEEVVDTVISSVEDNEICEEKGRTEESKEHFYIKDVLSESGINVSDKDSFTASLHASECPVNPLVFEELEKHWSTSSWPRCERKLLFDRVNSALVAVKQQFGDTHPWVKRGHGRVNRWMKNAVEENIHRLLEIQQKNAKKDEMEETDRQWLNLGDDIGIIGREIEKLLMEELANEMILGL